MEFKAIYFFYLILIILRVKTSDIDILSFKTLLNSKNDYNIAINKCFLIKVNHLFQHITLNINSQGIKRIIITNEKIDNFNIKTLCNSNSLMCFEYNNPKIINYVSNYCILSTYIYGCNISLFEQGIINISSNLNKEKNCISNKNNLFVECSKLSERCNNVDYCFTNCEYLNCINNSDIQKGKISLCIPKSKDEIKKELCENIFTSKLVSYESIPCESNRDLNKINSSESKQNKLFKSISIIIGIIIVLLILSSLYYRIKLKENGYPPFEAPFFIPGFIFPKPKKVNNFISNNR